MIVGTRMAIGSNGMGGRPGTGGRGTKAPPTANTQMAASQSVKGIAMASHVHILSSGVTLDRPSPSHSPHKVTAWIAIRRIPMLLNAEPMSGTAQTSVNHAAVAAATPSNLVIAAL